MTTLLNLIQIGTPAIVIGLMIALLMVRNAADDGDDK